MHVYKFQDLSYKACAYIDMTVKYIGLSSANNLNLISNFFKSNIQITVQACTVDANYV